MKYNDFPIRDFNPDYLSRKKLVRGVGINDAFYLVALMIDGKLCQCPIYRKWSSMLSRCYSKKFQEKWPTYIGCSVDKRWHSFMAFREWVLSQPDWEECELDKDLLVSGNKIYGPDTCIFIPQYINAFMTDSRSNTSSLPVGVIKKTKNTYVAQVCLLKSGRWRSRGVTDIELAEFIYKEKKLQVAEIISASLLDKRIAIAIIKKYGG